jgi:hypothetical protein
MILCSEDSEPLPYILNFADSFRYVGLSGDNPQFIWPVLFHSLNRKMTGKISSERTQHMYMRIVGFRTSTQPARLENMADA